jgi:hypothetical protein
MYLVISIIIELLFLFWAFRVSKYNDAHAEKPRDIQEIIVYALTILCVVPLMNSIISYMPISNSTILNFLPVIIMDILAIIAFYLRGTKRGLNQTQWIKTILIAGIFFIVISVGTIHANSTINSSTSSTSSTQTTKNHPKKEASTDESAVDPNWNYDQDKDIFNYKHQQYKFTGAKVVSNVDNHHLLEVEFDYTNNSKKEKDPTYGPDLYMKALQKTSSHNKNLGAGYAVDANGDFLDKTRQQNMHDDVLPGKTVQGAVFYQLANDNDVTLKFLNSQFKTVGSKIYKVK